MKKQLLSGLVAAAVLGTMALPASAQNIAIVNGKAVPMSARRSAAPASGTLWVAPDPGRRGPDQRRSDCPRNLHAGSAKSVAWKARQTSAAQMELARQTILIRELFTDYQKKKNPVTDAEIQAEYDKFVAANNGKEYKASHILVEKEADAKAIIASMKKGAKFEDLAKKQSTTLALPPGGDLTGPIQPAT